MPPKHSETTKITLAEEQILRAQEVSFIEISIDQHKVFDLEENQIVSLMMFNMSLQYKYLILSW